MTKWQCPKCGEEGEFLNGASEVSHRCPSNGRKYTKWEKK